MLVSNISQAFQAGTFLSALNGSASATDGLLQIPVRHAEIFFLDLHANFRKGHMRSWSESDDIFTSIYVDSFAIETYGADSGTCIGHEITTYTASYGNGHGNTFDFPTNGAYD